MGQSLNGFTLERLSVVSPETWVEYGEIVTIDMPPVGVRNKIEDTNSKDTSQRFLLSKVQTVDDLTVAIRFNPATAANKHWTAEGDLLKLAEDGTVSTWRISSGALSGSPAEIECSGPAGVSIAPGQLVNGENWEATITLLRTGKWTYEEAAA